MIILDKICSDKENNAEKCFQELKLLYPDIISVNHFDHEHIIMFKADLKNGKPKKAEFEKVQFNVSQKILDIANKEYS